MSQTPLRRRFRRRLTAFQARLDAGAGDRWIPYAIGLILSVVLSIQSVARLESLSIGNDIAGYTQSIWLLGQGIEPTSTILGEGVHLLELRWSFLLYLFAIPARFTPVAETLLVAQAVAIGVAVIPLWRLAREVARLRVGAATAICLAYALHPATQRIGTLDFHPEALALPGLLSMVYFGATKRWTPYWIAVATVLLVQADLGLVIAVFALLVLGDAERTTGLWTLGIGLVWSLGLLLVAQPLVGDSGVIGGVYGEYGDSFGDALLSSDPIRWASSRPVGHGHLTLLLGLLDAGAVPAVAVVAPPSPRCRPPRCWSHRDDRPSDGTAPILAFVMVSSVFALDRWARWAVTGVRRSSLLLHAHRRCQPPVPHPVADLAL